ncbi:MAG: formyltransferase family protein [Candidatus Levyibacteriota bacterium]
MKRLAVLISNAGTGTNLQAIIDAIEAKKLNAEIAVVLSDSSDAYGLVRADNHDILAHIFQKEETLEYLLTTTFPVDYIVLAGWKKIIPDALIDAFPKKILNIHPGLIPETLEGVVKNPDGTDGLWNKGKFTEIAIKNVLDSKATYAGSSIHFLSKEFDFGSVLARCFEKVLPGDTVTSLYTRLKKKENHMLVEALIKLCSTT